MLPNEFGKSVVIIIDKDAGDEGGIGKRHKGRMKDEG
jgi:hypothetical protein